MNSLIFIALILILGAFYLFVGWRASQRVHTMRDYFLAGRSLGPVQLAITLIATQIGGGAILGSSQHAFSVGLYGLLYIASVSVGLLILAFGLAARMRRLSVSTMPEIFEKCYNSSALRHVASILSAISLVGLLAAQVVASRNLMISLDVYNELLFLAFWASVIIYTALGGLRAVVDNDIYQLGFIIAVFCTLFGIELISAPAGVWQILMGEGARFSAESLTFAKITALIIVPASYVLIEQDMAQNIFAARTPRIALIGSFFAAVCMIGFSIIPVFYGMKAQMLNLVVPCGGNPLICLFDRLYSPAVVALVIYGVFAAIISTADALLCAISAHVVQDFHIIHSRIRGLAIPKVTTLLVGCFTLILGRIYSNALDLILASIGMAVVSLFVPLLVAYLAPRYCSKLAAWGAMAGGIGSLTIFNYTTLFAPASPEATALVLSLCGYCIGYAIERIGHKRVA